MTIVAHTRPSVICVDAHAPTHALAILATPTAEILDEAQFPATAAGLARAVDPVARRAGADLDAPDYPSPSPAHIPSTSRCPARSTPMTAYAGRGQTWPSRIFTCGASMKTAA